MTNPFVKRRPAQAGKFDAVPMLDLSRQYKQIREDVLRAVERVCASQHFILGEEVAALEEEIAAFTEAGHGIDFHTEWNGPKRVIVCKVVSRN